VGAADFECVKRGSARSCGPRRTCRPLLSLY
jgi:hypothetical protein